MELHLKKISTSGIAEALNKVDLYRCLNEPEEAESICQDILAVESEHQLALRMLGLSITDQFTGSNADRYADAQAAFERLSDSYERLYYTGLLHERRAKAHMRAGRPARAVAVWFEKAMQLFEDAEKIRPEGNDDSILRWNRCARLMHSLHLEHEVVAEGFEVVDSPPIMPRARTASGR
jgi:tetratricopeptide (TPR) repeat protein